MSWLFIRKLICLHKGKIKFTYKEEHKLVLILVFPVAIRQSEKSSDLSDLLSVPEFPTKRCRQWKLHSRNIGRRDATDVLWYWSKPIKNYVIILCES